MYHTLRNVTLGVKPAHTDFPVSNLDIETRPNCAVATLTSLADSKELPVLCYEPFL